MVIELPIEPWVIIAVSVWVIPWKVYAMWLSARKNQPIWFTVLLLVNSVAILEIIYIFIFSKRKPDVVIEDALKQIGKKGGQARDEKKEAYKEAIMSILADQGKITNDDIEQEILVSDTTVTNYLNELKKQGYITKHGRGRGVYYKAKSAK